MRAAPAEQQQQEGKKRKKAKRAAENGEAGAAAAAAAQPPAAKKRKHKHAPEEQQQQQQQQQRPRSAFDLLLASPQDVQQPASGGPSQQQRQGQHDAEQPASRRRNPRPSAAEAAAAVAAAPSGELPDVSDVRWKAELKRTDVKSGPFSSGEKETIRQAGAYVLCVLRRAYLLRPTLPAVLALACGVRAALHDAGLARVPALFAAGKAAAAALGGCPHLTHAPLAFHLPGCHLPCSLRVCCHQGAVHRRHELAVQHQQEQRDQGAVEAGGMHARPWEGLWAAVSAAAVIKWTKWALRAVDGSSMHAAPCACTLRSGCITLTPAWPD